MKVRVLIRKEREPETWKGATWLDPDEMDHLEPPSPCETSLSVEVACPPISEQTNLPLLENPVMTSIEVNVSGASLPNADLANTSAEWLIGQQQRPIHGPNMVPFPGGPACKFTSYYIGSLLPQKGQRSVLIGVHIHSGCALVFPTHNVFASTHHLWTYTMPYPLVWLSAKHCI